jgi:hypothetical protein
MNRHKAVIIVVAAICLCVLVGVGLRHGTIRRQAPEPVPSKPISFGEAQTQAFNAIRRREQWPASSEAVCQAFWDARVAKNYQEMEILWPGRAAADWSKACRDEPTVTYVFGKASEDGKEVPYAARDYFEAHGTYNLKMRLGVLQTSRGPRHYVVSGN